MRVVLVVHLAASSTLGVESTQDPAPLGRGHREGASTCLPLATHQLVPGRRLCLHHCPCQMRRGVFNYLLLQTMQIPVWVSQMKVMGRSCVASNWSSSSSSNSNSNSRTLYPLPSRQPLAQTSFQVTLAVIGVTGSFQQTMWNINIFRMQSQQAESLDIFSQQHTAACDISEAARS